MQVSAQFAELKNTIFAVLGHKRVLPKSYLVSGLSSERPNFFVNDTLVPLLKTNVDTFLIEALFLRVHFESQKTPKTRKNNHL